MTLSYNLVKSSALEILIYLTKKKALDIYFDPADDLILLTISKNILNKSHDMRFPTMWYVRPAKAQTSLRIHTV